MLTVSPEQEKKTELTPYEALEKDLRAHFETDYLEPGIVHEIPLPRNPSQDMGSAADMQHGVSQDLRAVIKSGTEFYFVIDTSTRMKAKQMISPDYVGSTFVTKFRPGETSQIVDYSVEQLFDGATTRPLNARIRNSQTNLLVAKDADGIVGIGDEGSKEWIEVFKQKADQTEPSELRLGGESTWQVHSSQVIDAMDLALNRY